MRTGYQILTIILLSLVAGSSIAEQASFGRFFTSPKERRNLDKLRMEAPDKDQQTVKVELLPEDSIETEEADEDPLDSLTVRGIVYRNDRKNTAWLNNSNTNEGDLGFGPIKVEESGISNDRVNISIPDNDTEIELKVGETYDPHSSAISDIADTGDTVSANRERRPAQNSDERAGN